MLCENIRSTSNDHIHCFANVFESKMLLMMRKNCLLAFALKLVKLFSYLHYKCAELALSKHRLYPVHY